MTQDMSCRCGHMHWRVDTGSGGTHVICYCADCQSFARHLGQAETMLDGDGGTEVFQIMPGAFHITQGADSLALLRLGPNGLFRWYARCCNTPIANTLPNPRRLPFIGVILPPGTQGFGPVTAQVNTAAARTPIRSHGFAAAAAALVGRALKARLTSQAGSELFDAEGAPIVTPHVLTREERDAARP